ncbi:MAG: hypothetical protein K2L24_00335, partial [Opitutales bacterium]|nr:hypothetical protein [Opitutales bacterium]
VGDATNNANVKKFLDAVSAYDTAKKANSAGWQFLAKDITDSYEVAKKVIDDAKAKVQSATSGNAVNLYSALDTLSADMVTVNENAEAANQGANFQKQAKEFLIKLHELEDAHSDWRQNPVSHQVMLSDLQSCQGNAAYGDIKTQIIDPIIKFVDSYDVNGSLYYWWKNGQLSAYDTGARFSPREETTGTDGRIQYTNPASKTVDGALMSLQSTYGDGWTKGNATRNKLLQNLYTYTHGRHFNEDYTNYKAKYSDATKEDFLRVVTQPLKKGKWISNLSKLPAPTASLADTAYAGALTDITNSSEKYTQVFGKAFKLVAEYDVIDTTTVPSRCVNSTYGTTDDFSPIPVRQTSAGKTELALMTAIDEHPGFVEPTQGTIPTVAWNTASMVLGSLHTIGEDSIASYVAKQSDDLAALTNQEGSAGFYRVTKLLQEIAQKVDIFLKESDSMSLNIALALKKWYNAIVDYAAEYMVINLQTYINDNYQSDGWQNLADNDNAITSISSPNSWRLSPEKDVNQTMLRYMDFNTVGTDSYVITYHSAQYYTTTATENILRALWELQSTFYCGNNLATNVAAIKKDIDTYEKIIKNSPETEDGEKKRLEATANKAEALAKLRYLAYQAQDLGAATVQKNTTNGEVSYNVTPIQSEINKRTNIAKALGDLSRDRDLMLSQQTQVTNTLSQYNDLTEAQKEGYNSISLRAFIQRYKETLQKHCDSQYSDGLPEATQTVFKRCIEELENLNDTFENIVNRKQVDTFYRWFTQMEKFYYDWKINSVSRSTFLEQLKLFQQISFEFQLPNMIADDDEALSVEDVSVRLGDNMEKMMNKIREAADALEKWALTDAEKYTDPT